MRATRRGARAQSDLLRVRAPAPPRSPSGPGNVLSREQLLREVWGYEDGVGERTVDSHIRGLRSKLGPDVIRTVRGAGYALRRAP